MSVKHRKDSIKEINEKRTQEMFAANNLTAMAGTVIDLEYRMILMEWGVTL